jgi:thioredoxin-dependent peroxiredoxin
MKLSTNIIVPVFRLQDVFGRTIDLDDYRDNKVLIAFFRHAGCPFCNLRVHALMKGHEELSTHGMKMIFFFESKQSIILRSSFHKGVSPVPIISDPQKIWYNAYGLEQSTGKSVKSHLTSFVQTVIRAKSCGLPVHAMASGESFSTMPAEFLLGPGLVVRKFHYSEGLNDRLDLSVITDFVKQPE